MVNNKKLTGAPYRRQKTNRKEH